MSDTLETRIQNATPQQLAATIMNILEYHYPIDGGNWGDYCNTCMENAGAVGADNMPWPCDIYATITENLEPTMSDDQHTPGGHN